jgi:hypothetical protein
MTDQCTPTVDVPAAGTSSSPPWPIAQVAGRKILAPREPVHPTVGVLQQVRRAGLGQAVVACTARTRRSGRRPRHRASSHRPAPTPTDHPSHRRAATSAVPPRRAGARAPAPPGLRQPPRRGFGFLCSSCGCMTRTPRRTTRSPSRTCAAPLMRRESRSTRWSRWSRTSTGPTSRQPRRFGDVRPVLAQCPSSSGPPVVSAGQACAVTRRGPPTGCPAPPAGPVRAAAASRCQRA